MYNSSVKGTGQDKILVTRVQALWIGDRYRPCRTGKGLPCWAKCKKKKREKGREGGKQVLRIWFKSYWVINFVVWEHTLNTGWKSERKKASWGKIDSKPHWNIHQVLLNLWLINQKEYIFLRLKCHVWTFYFAQTLPAYANIWRQVKFNYERIILSYTVRASYIKLWAYSLSTALTSRNYKTTKL